MTEDIRHLVKLQAIADEMRDLERQRQSGPARIEELNDAFRARVEEIGGERLRHEALVKESQALQQERAELQSRLQAGQQKLMQVNNQREYSAVLNEIDLMKARLGDVEAALAEREAEIETLAGPAAEADERIGEEKTTLDAEKSKIESDLSTIGTRLAVLQASRKEIEVKLPREILSRFDRILAGRGGIAVAPIDKTACGACHVKLRPQVLSLCRRADDLVFCDSCRRILYFPAEEPAAPAEQPAATAPAPAEAPPPASASEPPGDEPAPAGQAADAGGGAPGRPAAGA